METPTLDRARRFLAGVRDGGQFSDRFYLGDLEADSDTRFVADLAVLATIQVPTGKHRVSWIEARRIGRLAAEYARDLHVRLFNTIARLGFDDYDWFPDPDLAVLITEGNAEVAQLQMALADAQHAIQVKAGNGEKISEKLTHEVENKRKALAEAKAVLEPYEAERVRRQKLGATEASHE